MKKLMLSFLVILLLGACKKESVEQVEPTATEQGTPTMEAFLDSPGFNQQPPSVQAYVKELQKNMQTGIDSRSAGGKGESGSITSNEPVNNLEGQVTCVDESGHCSITRTDAGAHISYHAKGLTPGETYIIYVNVFNFDENCFPDFSGGFLSFVDAITLGEKVANPAGNLNLSTFLANGDNTNSWYGPLGNGITDAKQADLVVYTRIGDLFLSGTDIQKSGHYLCNPVDCFQ